jgi:deoxyribonuclease-1-like protein
LKQSKFKSILFVNRAFALLVVVFSSTQLFCQTLLCSWNIRDFGQSKDDREIAFIANTIKANDVIAIQEVVAGPGGAEAVARLADQLNRMGAKWDYVVSDPTSGDNSYKKERYAFLWKPSKAQRIGDPWLEKKYNVEIDREPFFMTFKIKDKVVTFCTFHAITKSMNPETEVKYFKLFPEEYKNLNIVFCGDFNLPQSHSVFGPLRKMGFESALKDQKTSLRQKCIEDDCLASEFDNVFFDLEDVNVLQADINHFYRNFDSIADALKISDHVPVIFRFELLKAPSTALITN